MVNNPGETVPNLESPGLSGSVDSPAMDKVGEGYKMSTDQTSVPFWA